MAPLNELRARVCEANRAIARAGLITLSFGNASGVDREAGVMLIKPSGFPYEALEPADLCAVSLGDGSVVDREHRPSSDTPTHLVLYRRFPSIGGVVHTHSPIASSWAQARRAIPCLGTTHADHFHGPVPVTRPLTSDEIHGDYERLTGEVIAETIMGSGLEPLDMSAVLVASHGPFSWGATPEQAVENAIVLELVAAMAWQTLAIESRSVPISSDLLDRHFRRKHGPDAYYGQPGETAEPRR
jgi:L-ribulose-5-phosphate 4-epimerase